MPHVVLAFGGQMEKKLNQMFGTEGKEDDGYLF